MILNTCTANWEQGKGGLYTTPEVSVPVSPPQLAQGWDSDQATTIHKEPGQGKPGWEGWAAQSMEQPRIQTGPSAPLSTTVRTAGTAARAAEGSTESWPGKFQSSRVV